MSGASYRAHKGLEAMELAIAIIGLGVAILALAFSGWTAWSSKRSADASIASADAAKSSAAASERAVQLESERLHWEQTARLAITQRTAYHGIDKTFLGDDLGSVVHKAVNDWPDYIGIELRNAGNAPAIHLDAHAIYLSDIIRPQDSYPISLAKGETAWFTFQLPKQPSPNWDLVKFIFVLNYHDVRKHELTLEMGIFSKFGKPDNPYLAHNQDGTFYKPSIVQAELDGSRVEELESGDVVWEMKHDLPGTDA